MEPGQERADEEVVDVPGPGLEPELRAQVGDELLEIVEVGPDRVGGGVALPLQVAAEGGQGVFYSTPLILTPQFILGPHRH